MSEHLESWSPEDVEPAADSKDLRLMGMVWRTLAQSGGAIPDALAKKLLASLLDKDGKAGEAFPAHLMRERRMFLEMLARQDQHDERMKAIRERLLLEAQKASAALGDGEGLIPPLPDFEDPEE